MDLPRIVVETGGWVVWLDTRMRPGPAHMELWVPARHSFELASQTLVLPLANRKVVVANVFDNGAGRVGQTNLNSPRSGLLLWNPPNEAV